ncbi:hypothetical protein GGD81_000634 [Rhodobium orientis]|uniref:Transcriptional regulator n=1 Tax=Rhodobium orientis TaxID=34017 RepID=A0A327JCQ7_9HYPH|nr:hypothetical protein [Rhodobium orientis]MBB4301617.1 hypothetical protein [Rhodobium orientis]MBK5952312.1 hypothetical protein [Rhodobium orientis]RAI23103.1 hypothetical protein CH339_23300 [Rhodobium orientis]
MEQDNAPTVYILIGRAWRDKSEDRGPGTSVNVVLGAPDDDGAVRRTLEALGENGFVEAELDKIGILTEVPEDEPFLQAYRDAMEGKMAVIAFTD